MHMKFWPSQMGLTNSLHKLRMPYHTPSPVVKHCKIRSTDKNKQSFGDFCEAFTHLTKKQQRGFWGSLGHSLGFLHAKSNMPITPSFTSCHSKPPTFRLKTKGCGLLHCRKAHHPHTQPLSAPCEQVNQVSQTFLSSRVEYESSYASLGEWRMPDSTKPRLQSTTGYKMFNFSYVSCLKFWLASLCMVKAQQIEVSLLFL